MFESSAFFKLFYFFKVRLRKGVYTPGIVKKNNGKKKADKR